MKELGNPRSASSLFETRWVSSAVRETITRTAFRSIFCFRTLLGLRQRFIDEKREASLTIIGAGAIDDWPRVQESGAIDRTQGELDATQALMTVPFSPSRGEAPRGEPVRHSRGMFIYRPTPTRMTVHHSEHASQGVEERESAFGGM